MFVPRSVRWSFGRPLAYVLLILAQAAVNAPAARADSCSDAATTAAMRDCENMRYRAADQQLNTLYARLLSQLDNDRRQKLRLAQRAWVQYRDANAEFLAAAAKGGSLAPLLKITAMADMTEARVKELGSYRQP